MNGAAAGLPGALPGDVDRPPAGPATILAFDYGARRIGVAVGNTLTGTATPLVTITAHDDGPDWEKIDALIDRWSPGALVVGLPTRPDGDRHELAGAIEGFTAGLRRRHRLPLYTVDELLTSASAASELRAGRERGARRIRRGDIDRAAAALIAETWLAEGAGDGR